ncbi:MAG: hypothetical protein L3J97_03555 [Thermoplasmata archaeon]|nr:hypothetical protein [Thermoplasmata archaeon]
MSLKRRHWTLLAIVLGVVGVAVSIVLVSILIFQAPSGYEVVNGKSYSFESESLFGNAAWLNYSYRGVTFGFHLWCQAGPAAARVCGNATESGGLSYSYAFWDGPPQLNPTWHTWTAPDQFEAVQYEQGGLVHLLGAA